MNKQIFHDNAFSAFIIIKYKQEKEALKHFLQNHN